jgi:hypothetical protein
MKQKEQLEHTLHNIASPKRGGYTFWGLWATLGVAAILIWCMHGHWLAQPNQFMLGNSADGLKNYMTSVWHIQRDIGYVHYEGMNYPYGEHELFTDNQPLVCAAIQWWSRHVNDVSSQAVGILNVFQAISLLLGVFFLFLLFRKLHLSVWYAGLASIGIVLLSPQYQHFDLHFGLSHTWVFPALLYLLCRYEERMSRRYQSLQIGLLVGLMAQLHLYYFGLAVLFLSLYTFYQMLQQPTAGNITRRLSHLAVMLILPFVVINIWLHWADVVHDRTAWPGGFLDAMANWKEIFWPYHYFPLGHLLSDETPLAPELAAEWHQYIGICAVVFSLWLLVLWLRKYAIWLRNRFYQLRAGRFHRPQVSEMTELVLIPPRLFPKSWNGMAYHRIHRLYLYSILLGSLLMLLFACGFPFAIPGMEWVLDYFGPLRQFRHLGRFTWAYYYVSNIVMFYVLWNTAIRFNGWNGRFKELKYAILWLPLVFLHLESAFFQHHEKPLVVPNFVLREITAPTPGHWLQKVDFSKYQAILPLPYYHIGSENINWHPQGELFRHVQTTALQKSLPDVGVYLSRTSIKQTLRSLQLVLEPVEVPLILDDMPDNRPLALMLLPNYEDSVRQKQPHILAASNLVFAHKEVKIFSFSPDSLRAAIGQKIGGIRREINSNRWPKKGQWLTDVPTQSFVYQSFDSIPIAPHIFHGQGAYTGMMCDTTWLFRGALPMSSPVLSFWAYAYADQCLMHHLYIEVVDAQGVMIQQQVAPLHQYLQSIADTWALIETSLPVPPEGGSLRVYLYKNNIRKPISVDELLIRSTKQNLWRQEPKQVAKNNRWYPLRPNYE